MNFYISFKAPWANISSQLHQLSVWIDWRSFLHCSHSIWKQQLALFPIHTCTRPFYPNVPIHFSLQSGLLLNKYTANSTQSNRWPEDVRPTQESPCTLIISIYGERFMGPGRFIGKGLISRTQVCWVDYVLGEMPEHLREKLGRDELGPAGLVKVSPAA